MHAQTLLPAINTDVIIPLGPYPSVEHTGNYLTPCMQMPTGMFLAMCWDGNSPGMAFDDGNGTITHALPSGIADPDIVTYCKDQLAVIMVVFERGNNVEYLIYNLTLPLTTPVQVNSGILATNAKHPNIDLNMQHNVAVVWSKPNSTGSSADIEYRIGDLQTNQVVWSTIVKQADNKGLNATMPQQNDHCLWPDIAISGVDDPGVHITFIEDSSGTLTWWKMDDDLIGPPLFPGQTWHSSFWQSGLNGQGADLTEPRIATSRSYFNRDWFEAVLTNIDVTGTHHVMGVNKLLSPPNTVVMLDWPLFMNGECHNAVVAWADDEYINSAWSVDDLASTLGFDIIVKRLDQQGQPYDNTWAIANQGTVGDQLHPSVAGVGIGMSPNQEHFAYLWTDDASALWFKIVPAANMQLKKELPVPEGNASINIFPNPAAEFIGIQTEEILPSTTYTVFDFTSKVLAKGNIHNHLHYINVSRLPNGTYFIVVNQNGKLTEKKIVIQH